MSCRFASDPSSHEMLYILLLNERDLSFTLYLLQVLNFYCPQFVVY